MKAVTLSSFCSLPAIFQVQLVLGVLGSLYLLNLEPCSSRLTHVQQLQGVGLNCSGWLLFRTPESSLLVCPCLKKAMLRNPQGISHPHTDLEVAKTFFAKEEEAALSFLVVLPCTRTSLQSCGFDPQSTFSTLGAFHVVPFHLSSSPVMWALLFSFHFIDEEPVSERRRGLPELPQLATKMFTNYHVHRQSFITSHHLSFH